MKHRAGIKKNRGTYNIFHVLKWCVCALNPAHTAHFLDNNSTMFRADKLMVAQVVTGLMVCIFVYSLCVVRLMLFNVGFIVDATTIVAKHRSTTKLAMYTICRPADVSFCYSITL